MRILRYLTLLFFLCIVNQSDAQLDLDFETDRGFYDSPFNLVLTTNVPNSIIRFTTNGTPPTATTGTIYDASIPISKTSFIRAIAYTDTDTTKVLTHTYIFVDDVINQTGIPTGYPTEWSSNIPADYDMDTEITQNPEYSLDIQNALLQIPSVSIVMERDSFWGSDGLYLNTLESGEQWERATSIELIDPLGNESGFQEDAGIRIHGGASRNPNKSPKHNLRLLFKEEYGDTKLEYPLFGKSSVDKFDTFVLKATYNNSWIHSTNSQRNNAQYLRERFMQQSQSDMGGLGVSSRHLHLYINGIYWGLYLLSERPNASFVAEHLGGDKEYYDALNSGEVIDGNIDAWDAMMAIANEGLGDYSNYLAIQNYLDIDNFMDYMILNHWGGNNDWDHHNWYAARERKTGAGYMFFIWDAERVLESVSSNIIDKSNTNKGTYVFQQLRENEEFRIRFADKLQCHFFNNGALTSEAIIDRWNTYYDKIDKAIIAESARWGDYRKDVKPSNCPCSLLDVNEEYMAERNRLLNEYFPFRTDIMLQYYRDANLYPSINGVQFNEYGGAVDANFQLTLINPNANGTIYYTLDGSDPRASGGGITNTAQTYNGSVSLPIGVVEVKARIKSGNIWSAMCPRTFFVGQKYEKLVINEIHYNTPDSIFFNPEINAQDTIDGKNFTFIELKNTASTPNSLSNLIFTKGIELNVDNIGVIPPGGFAVFAEDADWFEARYGFVADGQFTGKIDTDGEKIILADPFGNPIDSVRFYNVIPWDEAPDDGGCSLELLHASLDNEEPLNWFRSDNIYGTPKAENSRTCAQSATPIVINEINYNSDNDNFDAGDWVELYNPNSFSVDLSGWTFYDNRNKYVLPSGTVLGVDEYLVLIEDQALFTVAFPNTTNYIGEIGFSLSNKGERISLFDENKCLSDYVIYNDKVPWPEAADGDGATLVLLNPILDNAIAPHWASSNDLSSDFIHGSPGKSNLCAGVFNTVVSRQVSQSADDAEEKLSDGSINLSSKDLDLVNDDGVIFKVGIRFQDITIPQGAKISSAVLEFVADKVNIEATNLTIKGEYTDNASAFTATTNDISNRTTTSNTVSWVPNPWNKIGENGIYQKSVDLSVIIQEIIDRPNFISGNALALIIEGTGIRTAESFDGVPQLAPKLVITYTNGQCGVLAKIFLEGFFNEQHNNMHTKLVVNNLVPLFQPFNTAPWNYTGIESTSALPDDVVDWVLVMSRDATGNVISQGAGFIRQDGLLVDVDGSPGIPLTGALDNYVSIHPRGHLAVVSSNPYIGGVYDFTSSDNSAAGIEQLKLISGAYMLHAGDYDASGIINSSDFNKWKVQGAILNEYLPIDGDGNGIINAADYNLWIINNAKIGEPIIRY